MPDTRPDSSGRPPNGGSTSSTRGRAGLGSRAWMGDDLVGCATYPRKRGAGVARRGRTRRGSACWDRTAWVARRPGRATCPRRRAGPHHGSPSVWAADLRILQADPEASVAVCIVTASSSSVRRWPRSSRASSEVRSRHRPSIRRGRRPCRPLSAVQPRPRRYPFVAWARSPGKASPCAQRRAPSGGI